LRCAGRSPASSRDFTLARLRDIQTLLDSAEKLGEGVQARPITTREGYDRWAPFYDEPGNMLEIEQPIMREILDSFPPTETACLISLVVAAGNP
jgi:hypothetical protein